MHRPPRPSRRPRAFTLVEILVTLTIMGIMAGIVVPAMLSTQSLTIQAATRAIVADMLNAQNEAVAHQASRAIVFDITNNSYELTDGSGNVLPAPWRGGGQTSVVNLSNDSRFRGVQLVKADFSGKSSVTFDDLGSPISGGVIDITYDKWNYQITVAPFTGRITVKRVDSFN